MILNIFSVIESVNINEHLVMISFSPRRGKSSFSIGFLSKSASEEKKELSSMISDRITASGITSHLKPSQGNF